MAKNGQKWPKMAKNDHVVEAGKVRRSDATSVKGPLVNQPYLNWGGQIIPTYHYWPPQCFSPSSITELFRFSLVAGHFVLAIL